MNEKGSFDSDVFLKNLTSQPGVYRMLDAASVTIYVGKAKNLKNRVSSYFRDKGLPVKTRVMVSQIYDIEITITHTESEALLLENNLIKSLKPRYNILLRDDKSYPYMNTVSLFKLDTELKLNIILFILIIIFLLLSIYLANKFL